MLHNLHHNADKDLDGPTSADLAAIAVEWPQIQADIDMLADPDAVDALVDQIYALERGYTPRAWRSRRRAEARITRTALRAASRRTAA
ncbi:DUF6284 family protein [Actinoplanes friuliensis]|uniref:Uncharacterized protein n=1 Tax=Actinoplanes friuliensis DSM 7358 TaxID=1246995 RepID=U5VS38_9ACTN|nr:DUF6284 family protein [Actinoplanes friuliensis]AGZ39607.1 hypothetical protein AFR_06590 [Actinoplanes friuliensis DSM 7358]